MYLLKLLRPINLIIIAATMYGIGWYFEGVYRYDSNLGISSFTFFLLVISTVMIAGAGNIINDYFDVKADRINKPDRLIIGVHVKRRVAIVSHWVINFVAFGIAIYLSYRLQTYWYAFIHLLTINLLWYYSLNLKRQFFIGNFLIAGLTAMVPLLVGYYYYHILELKEGNIDLLSFYPFGEEAIKYFTLILTFAMSGFAFALNLAREITKDMEDVEGDKKIRAKTLPIVLGYAKTKWIAAFILFSTIVMAGCIWMVHTDITFFSMIPIEIAALMIMFCFVLLIQAKSKNDYRLINHIIKVAIVCGILIPVYWRLILMYA